jgi:hypothetical protein
VPNVPGRRARFAPDAPSLTEACGPDIHPYLAARTATVATLARAATDQARQAGVRLTLLDETIPMQAYATGHGFDPSRELVRAELAVDPRALAQAGVHLEEPLYLAEPADAGAPTPASHPSSRPSETGLRSHRHHQHHDRMRRPSQNPMKPRIQCVLTQWKPDFTASSRRPAADRHHGTRHPHRWNPAPRITRPANHKPLTFSVATRPKPLPHSRD